MVDYIEDSNSGNSQPHNLSAYSFFEISCIEESRFELIDEEGSLCVCLTHISPKFLQEHTNPPLFMDDKKYAQQYNQSYHMEQLVVCNEGLNHQEEY